MSSSVSFEVPYNLQSKVLKVINALFQQSHGRKFDWSAAAQKVSIVLNRPGITGHQLSRWVNDGVQKRLFDGWFINSHKTFRKNQPKERESQADTLSTHEQWSDEARDRVAAGARGVLEAVEAIRSEAEARELEAPKVEVVDAEVTAATSRPTAAITRADIAGLPLEVVEGEWVTLRSLFEPFGKRPNDYLERLGGTGPDHSTGWANLRHFPLPPKTVTGIRAENLVRATWCIHHTQAAQALADLNPTGMSDEIRARWIAYKRVCAQAVFEYFTKGVAVSPRFAPPPESPEQAALRLLGWASKEHERQIAESRQMASKATEDAARAKEEVAKVVNEAEAVRAQAEEARRLAGEGLTSAQRAISVATATERRTSTVEETITFVRETVAELAKRQSKGALSQKPSGWEFVAPFSKRVGLASQGPGKMIVNDLVDLLRGQERGLAGVFELQNGLTALAIHPQLQEEIVPYARLVAGVFERWGYRFFNGRMERMSSDQKVKRSFQWVREHEAMPAVIRKIQGQPQQQVLPLDRPKTNQQIVADSSKCATKCIVSLPSETMEAQ